MVRSNSKTIPRKRGTSEQIMYINNFMKQNTAFKDGALPPKVMRSTWKNLTKKVNKIDGGVKRSSSARRKSFEEKQSREAKKAQSAPDGNTTSTFQSPASRITRSRKNTNTSSSLSTNDIGFLLGLDPRAPTHKISTAAPNKNMSSQPSAPNSSDHLTAPSTSKAKNTKSTKQSASESSSSSDSDSDDSDSSDTSDSSSCTIVESSKRKLPDGLAQIRKKLKQDAAIDANELIDMTKENTSVIESKGSDIVNSVNKLCSVLGSMQDEVKTNTYACLKIAESLLTIKNVLLEKIFKLFEKSDASTWKDCEEQKNYSSIELD